MDITQIIGIAAGVFTASASLPQLFKIIKEKKAEDVSGWMLFVLLAGLGLWATYGFLIKDIPLIVTNTFSFVINLVLAYFRYKYKDK